MSNENTTASTQLDDAGLHAGQDSQSVDDIPVPMGPMAEALGIKPDEEESLPDEEESTLDPEDSAEEDDIPDEDAADEDDTDDYEEDADEGDEDEDEDDEDSTQDDELPLEEEVDWDYEVPVKIDGEIEYVSIGELRKGFATDQHLSKKGREVSELEKSLKEEYDEKTTQVTELGATLAAQLQNDENVLAKEYHDLEAKIEKARDDGDTYELNDLKDKRETAQKKYWEARNKREGLLSAIKKQQEEMQQEHINNLMAQFDEDIKELVPDFDADLVREFALGEGVPQEFLDFIMDARVVKFVDDYRRLKQKASTGSAKRKQAPKVKGVPTKRKVSKTKRKEQDTAKLRESVLSGKGTEASELEFLKSLSRFR